MRPHEHDTMVCGCFEHRLRRLNLRENRREHFGLTRQRLSKLLSTSCQSGEFGFWLFDCEGAPPPPAMGNWAWGWRPSPCGRGTGSRGRYFDFLTLAPDHHERSLGGIEPEGQTSVLCGADAKETNRQRRADQQQADAAENPQQRIDLCCLSCARFSR